MQKKKLLIPLLLLIMLALMLGSNAQKSLSWDEPVFIMNGLYYLQDSITYNSNQPILSGIIAGIPLTILGVEPLPYEEITWLFKDARNTWPYYGANDLATITFWSHIGFILFSLLLGYYVYKWSKELYGTKAGIFSLFLYTFSATILAWSVSATPDLLSIGLMFMTLYHFWNYLQKNKTSQLLIAGVMFGLAVSAKITALFILPVFVLGFILYKGIFHWKRIKQLIFVIAILGIVSLSSLTLVHLGDAGPLFEIDDPFYQSEETDNFRTEERIDSIIQNYVSADSPFYDTVKYLVTEASIPGRTFYQAMYTHSQDSVSAGRASYLFGEWKINGWWYYYTS